MTTTRLFCRYTGAEIVGCDESRVPEQAQFRHVNCCIGQTVHALAVARASADDGARLATPTVFAAVSVVYEVVPIAGWRDRTDRPSDEGPPVFLFNRALLI